KAIACAYAFVVDSAPSRPNRWCRRKSSATATTRRSSSSTVQYLWPDGNSTGNARTRSPRSRLTAQTTTSHEHHTHGEPPHDRIKRPTRATSRHRFATPGEGISSMASGQGSTVLLWEDDPG